MFVTDLHIKAPLQLRLLDYSACLEVVSCQPSGHHEFSVLSPCHHHCCLVRRSGHGTGNGYISIRLNEQPCSIISPDIIIGTLLWKGTPIRSQENDPSKQNQSSSDFPLVDQHVTSQTIIPCMPHLANGSTIRRLIRFLFNYYHPRQHFNYYHPRQHPLVSTSKPISPARQPCPVSPCVPQRRWGDSSGPRRHTALS